MTHRRLKLQVSTNTEERGKKAFGAENVRFLSTTSDPRILHLHSSVVGAMMYQHVRIALLVRWLELEEARGTQLKMN